MNTLSHATTTLPMHSKKTSRRDALLSRKELVAAHPDFPDTWGNNWLLLTMKLFLNIRWFHYKFYSV